MGVSMKKKLILFLCIALCMFSSVSIPIRAAEEDDIVYVTKSGKKYHRATCPTIQNSKLIAMTRADARKNHEACKVCKPDSENSGGSSGGSSSGSGSATPVGIEFGFYYENGLWFWYENWTR